MRATDLNLCLDTVIDETYESDEQGSNSSSNEVDKTEDDFRFGQRNVKKVPIIYTDSESDSNRQSSAEIDEEESDNEEHNIIADINLVIE
ncbi:hypothetical protein HUJ05_010809 [Dendroctonus ponderosae]|nr:hypothetical protein HUJ05_010809 [Dendroctonus ponderosae]